MTGETRDFLHGTSSARPWTSAELALLRSKARMGEAALAELLGRSRRSVRNQASRQGVSLRPPGVRGGLMLGQPRDLSLGRAEPCAAYLRAAREAWRRGELRLEYLGQYLRDLAAGRGLCPACSAWPQGPSGFCRNCDRRERRQRYLDALDYAVQASELERELAADRAARYRQRRKAAAT